MTSEINLVALDNPDTVRAALMSGNWGYTVLNDNITAKYCPICDASIPYGFTDAYAEAAMDKHRTYHIELAKILKRLGDPAA